MNRKIKIILALVNGLLLIFVGLALIKIGAYCTTLRSQQAAHAWAGESDLRFAQVSCFFPAVTKVDVNAILSFRQGLDKKLADAGLEEKTEGTYWTDAYSAFGKLTVSSDRGASEVKAIGVGGNFFMFHPYLLRSGGYISDSDLMQDRVVLSYELAWKLFGSVDLDGMTVKINGNPYYVAGVVALENDRFSQKTLTDEPVMFMSYSALLALDENIGVTSYELAMPDPISKFVRNTVSEGFTTYSPAVVENSTRYSFTSIFNIFRDFGDRSIANTGVSYPYWENAARVSEAYIARLYVIIAVLLLLPLICLAGLLYKLVRFVVRKLKLMAFKIWDAWDDRYGRREKRQEKKRLKADMKKSLPESVSGVRESQPLEAEKPDESDFTADIESIVREVLSQSTGPGGNDDF